MNGTATPRAEASSLLAPFFYEIASYRKAANLMARRGSRVSATTVMNAIRQAGALCAHDPLALAHAQAREAARTQNPFRLVVRRRRQDGEIRRQRLPAAASGRPRRHVGRGAPRGGDRQGNDPRVGVWVPPSTLRRHANPNSCIMISYTIS